MDGSHPDRLQIAAAVSFESCEPHDVSLRDFQSKSAIQNQCHDQLPFSSCAVRFHPHRTARRHRHHRHSGRPVAAHHRQSQEKGQDCEAARTEINNIVAAIGQYEQTYSRMPVSSPAAAAANPDFTFGTTGVVGPQNQVLCPIITTGATYQANNSDVISILMDLTNFPAGTPTVNTNHMKNPQRTSFLNAQLVGDIISPGVGIRLCVSRSLGLSVYHLHGLERRQSDARWLLWDSAVVSQQTAGKPVGFNWIGSIQPTVYRRERQLRL